MTTQIYDRAVPIDIGLFESIMIRLKGINGLWAGQETSLTYLDFPDNFPVREMHGDLLGYMVWDVESEEWLFQPVTHDEQGRDRRAQQSKNQPEPPPL